MLSRALGRMARFLAMLSTALEDLSAELWWDSLSAEDRQASLDYPEG